jgi:hypothetical protein
MSGPDVWGPHGWKFIHFITLGYPTYPDNTHKVMYKNFFESLKNVIPCSICGAHFKQHMEEYPLTDEILNDKMKFIGWGIKMHNLVNLINNKKIYSFDDGFKTILDSNKDECTINIIKSETEHFENNDTSTLSTYLLYIILIILIIFIVYRYINK